MTGPPLWRIRFDACAVGADLTTPEGRFAFDARLREAVSAIEPAGLRAHYEHFFRRARAALFLTIDAPSARLLDEGEW